MKVLITGATGLIGQSIVKICLAKNISVHYLTTSKEKITKSPNYLGFYWNPKTGDVDSQCLNGVTKIINLAGATIAQRWTPDNKKAILNSRIESLKTLYQLLNSHEHHVEQLVTASAIGIYPDSLTNYYEEDSTLVSTSFLGEVVKAWEAQANVFSDLDIHVTKIRIGLVLASNGGLLQQMTKPMKLGLGAIFGNGQQWQSWIHISDLSKLFVYAFKHEVYGTINGVAPNPVSHSEFTKILANVMNRPLWLPNIPKALMRLILGEMHILLFESQRVSSKRMEDEGFDFKFANLRPALEDLV